MRAWFHEYAMTRLRDHALLVISGPTASGKSALAVDLAHRLREQSIEAVILNADAMQRYHELPILTGIPSERDREGILHEGYGDLSVSEAGSVVGWAEQTAERCGRLWREGRLPVLVGGSGLYIKALLEGLSPVPLVEEALLEGLRALPLDEAYDRLAAVDSVMAGRLHRSDRSRVIRALAVHEATGRSLASWQALPRVAFLPRDLCGFHISLEGERGWLEGRSHARFEASWEGGALIEVEAVMARGGSVVPKILGFDAMKGFLQGVYAREDAMVLAKTQIRQYIKRQQTWMRHQWGDVAWVDAEKYVRDAGQDGQRLVNRVMLELAWG
jgi:tRNA dimethylallyltransferase